MIADVMSQQSPRQRAPLKGRTKPRIAPPLPLKSDVTEFRKTAEAMGITLMPWQLLVARYIEARTAQGNRLFPEICVEVSRQNGKTTIAKPLITRALRAGLRVLHIADKRELPREMHNMIANALSKEPELFPTRRGKTVWPRYGAGQEEIELANGGRYRIATKTGGRGWAEVDILIIDELREMEDFAVIAAASSTQAVSADPLTIYFSNAGTDKSVVLNSVRDRAGKDPNLAYLEWSADPERTASDRRGWTEANPALGHQPSLQSWLEREYLKHLLAGTMPIFETENLCRSMPTLMPRVVPDITWQRARGTLTEPVRPAMAVKVDPEGRRASAAIAWMAGGRIYVRSFAEDTDAPLNVDVLAAELMPLAKKQRVDQTGYDPWTDRDLARNLTNTVAINGADYQAACERFVRAVEGGQLVHDDDGTIASDLAYTVRRETSNGWLATRADAERPTTSVEAVIRAVWLATKPAPPKPRVF
jgi:phage terminase large subunit-like protein